MHLVLLALQLLCPADLRGARDIVVNMVASFMNDSVMRSILVLLAHGTFGIDQGDIFEKMGSFLLAVSGLLAAHVDAGLLHDVRPAGGEPVDVHCVACLVDDLEGWLSRWVT